MLYILKTEEVDVNKCNIQFKTPLYLALEKKNQVLVSLLLENGADVNILSYCSTYSTFEAPLVTAARNNDLVFLKLLMKKGCKTSSTGTRTALQWAAQHGNIDMADLLIDYGEDINALGPFRNTALHYAVTSNETKMVAYLLQKGADKTINGDGRSPLHLAAVRNNSDCAMKLINNCYHIDIKDNYHFTPFSLACLKGNLSLVNFMLKNYEVKKLCSSNLNDGLRCAAEYGHVSVMSRLLALQTDINNATVLGETALTLASRGQLTAVELLLKHNADLTVTDKRGYMPLQLAIQSKQMDIALLLIKHGAPLYSKNAALDSPLKLAMTISNPTLVISLLEAGYNTSKEAWFNKKYIEDKIKEVDYKYPRSYHQNNLQTHHKQMWQKIIIRLQRTPSLLESSRISIRTALLEGSKGGSIIASIPRLPLPKCIKEYVELNDY